MLWYRGMIGNDIDGGWGMMWIGFCKILSLAPIGRAAEPFALANGAIAEPWKAGFTRSWLPGSGRHSLNIQYAPENF